MKTSESQPEDREALQEIANAWKERYKKSIEEYILGDEVNREGLASIILEKGILDHIAPLSEEERDARLKLDKEVWNRDEPEPYLQTIYSLSYVKHAVKHSYTIMSGNISRAINEVLLFLGKKSKYDAIFEEDEMDGKKVYFILIDEIIKQAQTKLEKMGAQFEGIIPIGTRGKFKGIDVTIDRYTEEGNIVLKAKTYEGHGELYNIEGRGVVSPTTFHSDDFKIIPDS